MSDNPTPSAVSLVRLLKWAGFCLVLVVALDLALGSYDLLRDPATRRRGVQAASQPVTGRTVLLELNDLRRISNLQFRLAGRRLDAAQLERLRDPLEGWLDVSVDHDSTPMPELLGYDLRVELQPPVASPRIEHTAIESAVDRALDEGLDTAHGTGIGRGVRYDLSCLLQPLDGQRERALAVRRAEFPAGRSVTVVLGLHRDVPDGLHFVIHYSRRPRSFLHGTPLAVLTAWLGGR